MTPISLAHIPVEKWDMLLGGMILFQRLPDGERQQAVREMIEALLQAWPSPA